MGGRLVAALLAVMLLVGIGLASYATTVNDETVTLSSDAFAEGGAIPARYTCDGDDVSPPLAWEATPDEVGAYTLVVRDPDAGGFVHWVLTDIPHDVNALPDGQGDTIGIPGQNDFGRVGWGGPCPPSGEHRYEFRIYALAAPLELDGAPTADEVDRALGDKVMAEGILSGVYTRNR
jgi:Raf kinase inhibitor-like YbhB/YbcL family protein